MNIENELRSSAYKKIINNSIALGTAEDKLSNLDSLYKHLSSLADKFNAEHGNSLSNEEEMSSRVGIIFSYRDETGLEVKIDITKNLNIRRAKELCRTAMLDLQYEVTERNKLIYENIVKYTAAKDVPESRKVLE